MDLAIGIETRDEYLDLEVANGAINLVQDTTKSQHFLLCNFHSNEFPLW